MANCVQQTTHFNLFMSMITHLPPKLPLSMDYPQTQLPASSLDLSDLPFHIWSAVLPLCSGQTHTQTNKWLEGMFN